MDRPSRGFAVLALLALVAGVGVALLRQASPSKSATPESPGVERTPAVRIETRGLDGLVVSSSSLTPTDDGWQHEVTVRNVTPDPIHLDDDRQSEWLGDRELIVADENCGYAVLPPGGPVEPVCRTYYRGTTLPAAESSVLPIRLYRGLPSMRQARPTDYVYRKPLEYRSGSPFAPGDRVGVERGELVITYSNLG